MFFFTHCWFHILSLIGFLGLSKMFFFENAVLENTKLSIDVCCFVEDID